MQGKLDGVESDTLNEALGDLMGGELSLGDMAENLEDMGKDVLENLEINGAYGSWCVVGVCCGAWNTHVLWAGVAPAVVRVC